MSWMRTLSESYDQIEAKYGKHESGLWPLSHILKAAHVEVCLDPDGNYKPGRVRLLEGESSQTFIPATEASSGRSGSKIAPHPLCEELSYCAGDLPNLKKEKYQAYMEQLRAWKDSDFCHPKVQAIFNYLDKRTLWADLSGEVSLPVKYKSASGQTSSIAPEKVFVRWSVEEAGNPQSGTWQDPELIAAWAEYDKKANFAESFCFISGENTRGISNHSRFIRTPADGAKLISSNDDGGFTFRGRFSSSRQSAEIGFEVSQKAHNALRWLVKRQGNWNEGQVIVAWAVSGNEIPQPLHPLDLDDYDAPENDRGASSIDSNLHSGPDHSINLGVRFAEKLKRHMQGYRENLGVNDTISVMALDSATPGRMGIVYYRESMPAEYLDDITAWHEDYAWPQRSKKEITLKNGKTRELTSWPIQAPSPYNILNAVYGDVLKSNKPLAKQLYQRLLPCLLERASIPQDILKTAHYQACKTSNKDYWECERNIGVACSLYKGNFIRQSEQSKRRAFTMALDTSITSRDYLYGRLLAIAEHLEDRALRNSNVNRPTTAIRLMQRFSDRPYSTWLTIYKHLDPYMKQLNTDRCRGFLENRNKDIDQVMGAFDAEEFKVDEPLKGEFLLGFHCQRLEYRKVPKTSETANESE